MLSFDGMALFSSLSPLETHEAMGRIEKAHRSIVEAATTFIIDAKLPETLWEHAIEAATYLANQPATKANTDNQCPFDKFGQYLGFDIPNNISSVRTWGCKAYMYT